MRLLGWGLAALAVVAVLLNFWFDASREASRRGGTPGVGDVLSAAPVSSLRVPAAVTDAQNSVFYVQGPRGAATAFLIDAENLIFATNAHVPRRAMEAAAGQPAKLTLRQANNLKFECTVEPQDVREHPGHELLTRLVDRYSPVIARTPPVMPPGAEKLKIKPSRFDTMNAVLGFDGAILKARKENCNFDVAKPPRALELASQAEMDAVTAGNLIARVSFPGGSSNLNSDIQDQNTVPRVDIGYVRAIDGYLPQPNKTVANTAVKHLVAHTMPSSGGGSGSPMLNAAGHVVAVHQGGLGISGAVPVLCLPVSPLNVPQILRPAHPCTTADNASGRLVGRLDPNDLTQAVARENFAHRADMIRDLVGQKTDAELTAYYTAEIGKSLSSSLPMVDVLEKLNLQQVEDQAIRKSAAFDPAKVTTVKYTLDYDKAYAAEVCADNDNPARCPVRYVQRLKLEPNRNLIVQATDVAMGYLCEMDMEIQQVGTNVRVTASGQKPVVMVEGPLPNGEFDLILTRKGGCTGQAEYLEKLTWNAHAAVSQFDLNPGTAAPDENNGLISAIQGVGRAVRQTVDLVAAPPKDPGDSGFQENKKK